MQVRHRATLRRLAPSVSDQLSFRRATSSDLLEPFTINPLILSPDSALLLPAGRWALIAAAAFVAGVMNAIAGGGTLLTFPALVAIGMPPLVAKSVGATAPD